MNELVAVRSDGAELRPGEAARRLGCDEPDVAWQEGLVSLTGRGPMVHLAVTAELVVLTDGRVDDDGLGGRGHGTAADRIAQAVATWGDDFLDHVVGDVSGVVVDRRSERLVAFRDLVGPRVLHLAHTGGRHWVATRAQRLVGPAGPVRQVVCEEWMARFLQAEMPPPRLTPYAGVTLVVPGHVATPSRGSWLQTRRATWSPVTERRTDQGHAEAVRDSLDTAVRDRLAGCARAGVELSGGMDSTSVLASARAVRPDLELVALAIPFTDAAGDERALQALAAARCGARLTWVDLDASGPLGSSADDVVTAFGAPPQVPNWQFHVALRRAAAQQGVDVVLTGEDGDGLVGAGPAVLAHLLTSGRVLRLVAETAAVRRTTGVPLRTLVRRTREAAGWRTPTTTHALPSLVPARLQQSRTRPPRPRPGRLWASHVEAYLSSNYLPWLATSIGQAWEGFDGHFAHPFLDRRLVELCMGLPPQQRLSHGLGKAVLRRAMVARLPAEVLTVPRKAELSAPFARSMRSEDARRGVDASFARAQGTPPDWLSVEGWKALRSLADSTARDFAEYRAVMAEAFAHWVDHDGDVSGHLYATLQRDERG